MSKKGSSDSIELTEKPQANNSPYEPTAASLQSAMKPEKKSKVLCYAGIATTMAILALVIAMAALILVVIAFRDISQQPQTQTNTGTYDSQTLQSQLNSYSQQLESLQSQLNNYNQIIQAQITNFNQAIQSQLTNHNQQIQELQSQQSTNDQAIESLLSQQSENNQQIQELNEATRALQSQHTDSQQEIQSLQSQQTSYHQENQALQVQIQQINETAGRPGPAGPSGPAGPASGGVVYTRWASSNCSNVTGTELIYSGTAGGSRYERGGTNILCMPEDPEYTLPFQYNYQAYGPISLVTYSTASLSQQYSPCAVCLATTRETVLMIPAKTSCPSSWTREYEGYLMAGHFYNRKFVCVDQEISPTDQLVNSLLYHTENDCAGGLPCPPYTSEKELNCVVCTK